VGKISAKILITEDSSSVSQSTLLLTQFSQEQPSKEYHRLSFGLGYISHNLFLTQRPFSRISTIFSAAYSYTIADGAELEASVLFNGFYDDVERAIQGIILTSLTGEITYILQPFKDAPLRIGLGPALRWYNRLCYLDGADIFGILPRIHYVEAYQLGISAKAEYLFPVAQSLDIGVRLQSQFFFHPFSLKTNAKVASLVEYGLLGTGLSVVSAGVFLRIGF